MSVQDPGATAPPTAAADANATQAAPAGGAGAPGAGGAHQVAEHDWTAELADRIESVVGMVREKTTVPVTKIARAVVFGLLIATLGAVALVLSVVALVRFVDVYLPFDPYARRVWVTYAVLGAIFLLAGAFCWAKRTPRKSS
jgi:hypothetical protein